MLSITTSTKDDFTKYVILKHLIKSGAYLI